jgi:hypothetical protein
MASDTRETGSAGGGAEEARRGESLAWFLLVLAVLGCFVNTRNQLSWNVQHAWVESLAERGTMALEGSPTWQFALPRLVDVWVGPDGHTYARNAPGTCLTAAAVYAALAHTVGLRYETHFDLASTLVVFLTTCVASALTSLLLYRVARRSTGSPIGAACVASAYSFGTLAFPYSGALYQHQAAAPFFFGALALGLARLLDGGERRSDPLVQGLLLGLGTAFSFAYAAIAAATALHLLWPPRRTRTLLFAAGAALGVAPLLYLNARYYGGALTTVYQAARDYQVTTLEVSWDAVVRRLHFYLTDPTTGVFFYCPILLLALPGLALLPRELTREKRAVALGAVLVLAHLLVVSGIGALQFGPRLLLPLLPFLALGLVPYWTPGHPLSGRPMRAAFLLLLGLSVLFCTLGALGTTVFRDVARWNAWYVYLHALRPPPPEGMPVYNLTVYRFPLRPVLAWAALAAAALYAWRAWPRAGTVPGASGR